MWCYWRGRSFCVYLVTTPKSKFTFNAKTQPGGVAINLQQDISLIKIRCLPGLFECLVSGTVYGLKSIFLFLGKKRNRLLIRRQKIYVQSPDFGILYQNTRGRSINLRELYINTVGHELQIIVFAETLLKSLNIKYLDMTDLVVGLLF